MHTIGRPTSQALKGNTKNKNTNKKKNNNTWNSLSRFVLQYCPSRLHNINNIHKRNQLLLGWYACCIALTVVFGMGNHVSTLQKTATATGTGTTNTAISTMIRKASKNSNKIPMTRHNNNNNNNGSGTASRAEMENRLRGALWGFFAGDALASPTHWFYGGRRQVVSEYGHLITDYTKPNQHLAGSILNKSDPNGGGRSKNNNNNNNGPQTIVGDVINHGKLPLWAPGQSNHYHATLRAGENTLEASIARVLLRSITANRGSFRADHFRDAYVAFMTTPGSHNDAYASTCHRMFFANLVFRGLPPKECPDNDRHNVDTIDGLVLPTIVALAGSVGGNNHNHNNDVDVDVDLDSVARSAAECASVTRRSSVLEETAASWSRVVVSAVRSPTTASSNDDDDENDNNNDNGDGDKFRSELDRFARATIQRRPDPSVNDDSTMSACYLGSSLPGVVDFVAKYAPDGNDNDNNGGDRVWQGLLANANVGGENVHKGSVLGAILGARGGFKRLPTRLVAGLVPREDLEKDIDDFVRAVLSREE